MLVLRTGADTFMRAPGDCRGMFALESAVDELAIACGLDPIEREDVIRDLPITVDELLR